MAVSFFDPGTSRVTKNDAPVCVGRVSAFGPTPRRSVYCSLKRLRQRTAEHIIDVHVPQVVEESVQVFLITPLERISERAVSDCLCASTSDLGEIVSVVGEVQEWNNGLSSNRGCAHSTGAERMLHVAFMLKSA